MAEMLNKKSVLRTAGNKDFALRATKVMLVMLCMAMFFGCNKEFVDEPAPAAAQTTGDSLAIIRDHYSQSERTLAVTATPNDTLVKSDVEFQFAASMRYSTEAGSRYNFEPHPTAYAYVREKLPRIEVRSEAEVRPHLVKRQVIKRTPFDNNFIFGEDVVEEFTYDDGQIDQLFYGYRYMGLLSGVDTLQTPHVEFSVTRLDTINVVKHGEQTELDKPYKVSPKYVVSFTTKGVSGAQKTSSVALKPWYIKSITSDPQVVTGEITYDGQYVGCPITHYELVQTVPTNKGVVVNKASVPVIITLTAPELREQPSLDSLFASISKGTFKERLFSESLNEDGFTVKTKQGTYVSKNVGTVSKTSIESTINFTYSYPTKFENKWGKCDIDSLQMSFEEAGFTLKSVSQDEDNHVWLTTNSVIPTIGKCQLDVVDELVRITVAKEKKAIPVDSTYVLSGKGDEYIVDKTVFLSDGSKTTAKYQYDGRHSATAVKFGEMVTSNLSWKAGELTANGSTKESEKKEFTPATRFEVVYTTTSSKADATNAVESGQFGFNETHPVVKFVDGEHMETFAERKVILSGKGAQPATDYSIVVRDGVNYKGYTYNYSCGVIFDGEAEADVTSQGLLLIVADEVSAPKYTHEQTWGGNTTTVKVIKTIEHSFGEDEVETYTSEYTVDMTELTNGKVYAENFNFSADVTNDEKTSEAKNGFWTTKSTVRNFKYVVSNGVVKREMSNVVTDGEIVFNDGSHTFTFPAHLNVASSESFGDMRTESDYRVSPHVVAVTATIIDGPTLKTTGTTDVYVEQDKIGGTTYTTEDGWNGLVYTAKVIKTTKHTKADPEVETFTKSFTVDMTNLSDGRIDAENTNFSATVTNKEKTNEAKDGHWTTKSTVRDFTYVVSNGAVKREMKNSVTDGELVFTDGEYTHTFKARLGVSHKEDLGTTTTVSDFQITPHTVTVTATAVGGPTLSTKGVTSIYVEQDKAGKPTYQTEESWSGNTFIVKVTETIPHTKAEPEVNIYTQQVTVSMGDLTDGRVDAENTNFSATVTNTENVSEAEDGPWTIKTRNRDFTYVVSNGAVKRVMSNIVTDATITFAKGTYTKSFKPQLTVSHAENKGTTTTEGDFQITPHTVTVTATASGSGAPTLTTKGVTSIYVEVKKEITYTRDITLRTVENNVAIYKVLVQRLLNGTVEKEWKISALEGIKFGRYEPNVGSQVVKSLEILRHEDTVSDELANWASTYKAGTGKAFDVTTSGKEFHFRTFFESYPDPFGVTERELSGHLVVSSAHILFTDPDNGHTEEFDLVGKAESVRSEVVDTTYYRTIHITGNGQLIEEQTGTMGLILK